MQSLILGENTHTPPHAKHTWVIPFFTHVDKCSWLCLFGGNCGTELSFNGAVSSHIGQVSLRAWKPAWGGPHFWHTIATCHRRHNGKNHTKNVAVCSILTALVSFLPLWEEATRARYWMTFLVFSVLPAPDSPLESRRDGLEREREGGEREREWKKEFEIEKQRVSEREGKQNWQAVHSWITHFN